MTSLLNSLHFRGFNLTPCSLNRRRTLRVFSMCSSNGGTKYDVIQVRYTNSVPQVPQTVFHKTLKCSRGSGKAKWYPNPFVKAPWSDKNRQRSAVWTHKSLMICFPLIKDRKPGIPAKEPGGFLNSGYRVTVWSCLLGKRSEIHTQP